MAISLVATVSGASSDSNGFTTGSMDSSGASLLVLAVSYAQGAAPTISDSKSNTWTGLTAQENAGGGASVRLYYVANPTVGSSHTFTCTGAASFPALSVASYRNVLQSVTPFDQQNGAKNASAGTLATGSVTPSFANELLVAAVGCNANPSSIDSSFTTRGLENLTANSFGCGLADLIQTAAAAANPTWTISAVTGVAAVIATFRAGGTGQMFAVF